MEQTNNVLVKLIDLIINVLNGDKVSKNVKAVEFLQLAKNELAKEDKKTDQKLIDLARDFTDPKKNKILKMVEDKIDSFAKTTKAHNDFQKNLQLAVEEAKKQEILSKLQLRTNSQTS